MLVDVVCKNTLFSSASFPIPMGRHSFVRTFGRSASCTSTFALTSTGFLLKYARQVLRTERDRKKAYSLCTRKK